MTLNRLDTIPTTYVSCSQAAALMNVSERTLRRQVLSGILPAEEIERGVGQGGVAYRVPLAALPAEAQIRYWEELGRAEEKILFGTAQEFAQKQFASLSVLLVEHLPQPPRRVPGFPDEAFHRGEVPMTKQEVRAAALAKLAVQPGDTLWDVGAGTGSVSVELALAAPRGHVYACLLYTSPSPRDLSTSRMPSSA